MMVGGGGQKTAIMAVRDYSETTIIAIINLFEMRTKYCFCIDLISNLFLSLISVIPWKKT